MTTTTKKPRRKSPPQMKVIDKFLPTSDFIAIRDIFINEDLPWYLGHGISGSDATLSLIHI